MTLLFVAGSHTEVGKTHVACALLRAGRAAGWTVDAFKPVMSGFDPDHPEESDAGRLLAALGRRLTPEALDAISPLRFEAPLAPALAARRHGVRITQDSLLRRARDWLRRTKGDLGLLEGAGGVMSPIADDATNLDVIDALGLPVLLVGGAYLGAVSHTLSALEVLRTRGVPVAALVISAGADPAAPDFRGTMELSARFARGTPVFAAPRAADTDWAPDLLGMVSGRDVPRGRP